MSSSQKVRRVLVLWCPDWPVVSGLADAGLPDRLPAAVLEKNAVVACNGAARADGVRRGMRRRDAQSRCPELVLLEANPERDARAFEPVAAAVEELRPGVDLLRPGLLALHVPDRFYGGEVEAAAIIAERVVDLGVWDCRVGVADNLFAAEQAARQAAPQDTLIVSEGGSAGFLQGLPVEALDDPDLVGLLRRLGIRTLGDLAGLPRREVQARFGAEGARIHRLARGDDDAALALRTPPPDLVCQIHFEPPLVSVETVCSSLRRTADRFVAQLAGRHLVCTRVEIQVECEGAEREGVVASSQSWAHVRWFRATDLIDRVHWQLSAQRLPGPVGLVRLIPEAIESSAAHAEGLWGGGTDEDAERGITRVQAMLGYDAVVVPVLQGGRAPVDRQALVPWGERPSGLRPRELPWPGSVPDPAPTRVFAEPLPASMVGADGRVPMVSDRGAVTSAPTRFCAGLAGGQPGSWQQVAAWAGPWPVDELWWEEDRRRVARFQVVGFDGRAWLMVCMDDQWWIEASYD